jgi:DNA-binding NarL/FixJ family response regulator
MKQPCCCISYSGVGSDKVIRLLLVDDNAEFLRVAADFLSTDPWVDVVGQARSGRDALRSVVHLDPDLVIMDLAMSGMDGFEATRHIKSQPDAPYVIILTLYGSAEYRVMAQESGADGYVVKSELGDQLLPLIHELCE